MNDERTCHDLRLPDFLGIGPERTGTTWLHEALTAVACLPRVKETHFFSTRYERGIEWYAGYFRHCRDSAVIGEICPYFGYFEATRRVRERIPRCKIICTFRDPSGRGIDVDRHRSRTADSWGRSDPVLIIPIQDDISALLRANSLKGSRGRCTRICLQWSS
jgi:hypothetical protein